MPDPGEDAVALRAFVAERDVPCPGCGYSLRGLTGATCPECRQGLELRVGLVEPKLGALLATLSGLLAGSGTAVVILGIMGYATLRMGGGPMWDEVKWFLLVVVSGMSVEIALAVWLARARGRLWFRTRPAAARRWLAVGAWALTVGLAIGAIETAK